MGGRLERWGCGWKVHWSFLGRVKGISLGSGQAEPSVSHWWGLTSLLSKSLEPYSSLSPRTALNHHLCSRSWFNPGLLFFQHLAYGFCRQLQKVACFPLPFSRQNVALTHTHTLCTQNVFFFFFSPQPQCNLSCGFLSRSTQTHLQMETPRILGVQKYYRKLPICRDVVLAIWVFWKLLLHCKAG